MLDQYENRIITHVCSISDHPVSKLPMKIRENYLQGLRAILPMSEPFMNALFKAWEISILEKNQLLSYNSSNPKEEVKKAIKVNRIGWHWFRLAYPFFFDCFYLTSICGNTNAIQRQYEKLSGYCNLFTKKALQRVYEYFKNGSPCERIPEQLVKHRDVNLKFESAPLKRVLVVANVSAGKSTLINALVGYKLNKTATNACTKELCYIFGKPQNDGLTIKTRKERKYLYDCSIGKYSSDDAAQIGVHFSAGLLQGKKICFIDTPGFNDARNPERRSITENAIRANEYDMVMYVANAAYMGRDDEQHLLETIVQNTKKPIIFVMNGLDRYIPEEDSIANSIEDYRKDIIRAGISKPIIAPISAYFALLLIINDKGQLSEKEKTRLEELKGWFAEEYYNLPSYVINGKQTPNKLIYKTGLCYLEEIIQRI